MKKVILFAVIALMGTTVNAQKFGHINTGELLSVMPETKKAQDKLQKMQDSLNTSYAELIKEYREKDSIIRADSSKWTPAKKDIKFKEWSDLANTSELCQWCTAVPAAKRTGNVCSYSKISKRCYNRRCKSKRVCVCIYSRSFTGSSSY